MSCKKYKKFFQKLHKCLSGLTWVRQLAYLETFYLILEFLKNVKINDEGAAKIPFHSFLMFGKMFMSKKRSIDNQHV